MTSRANRERRKSPEKKKKKWTNKAIRTMAAAAHNPDFAARHGIDQSAAKKITEHKAESGELSRAMKARKK